MRTKAGNSSITHRPSESNVGKSTTEFPNSATCVLVGYPPICESSGSSEKLVEELGGHKTPVMPSSARMGEQTACRV